MRLKQVKSEGFEVLLVLVDGKEWTCATLEAEQENGLRTSENGSF